MEEEKLKSMTLSELATKYNISRQTMKTWINKIAEKKPEIKPIGYIFSPFQLKIIFQHLD